MSVIRRRRLERLEKLLSQPSFVPGPPAEAVAAALRAVLAEIAIVRRGDACMLPVEPPQSDAARRCHAMLDTAHQRMADQEAKAERRRMKLERRRLRREQAAREGAREAVGTATIPAGQPFHTATSASPSQPGRQQ
jgi:hypothetical protein